ncbi:MAG: phosphatidate cytidylyltransferase [Planctomycetia bacterium]
MGAPHDPPAAAAPAARVRHPVLLRLVVAPLVLAVVGAVAWTYVASGSPLGVDLLMALMGAAGGWEMARLLAPGTGSRAEAALAALACGLLGGIGLLAPDSAATRHLLRVGLVGAALVALMARRWRDTSPGALDAVARGLVPVVYVGLLFSTLREVAAGDQGARCIVWVVLVSKASDMGGWLVGKPLGRHKLVPSISPGKSWEGLAGGLAASVLVAAGLAGPLGVAEARWGTLHLVLFGLAVGAASVLAGITQSAWKRRAGVKDSSPLIPEMGGVLDMLDSLLFAAPLAWAWIRLAARL